MPERYRRNVRESSLIKVWCSSTGTSARDSYRRAVSRRHRTGSVRSSEYGSAAKGPLVNKLRGSSAQEGNVAHTEPMVLPFLVQHHTHALEHGLASGVGRPSGALRQCWLFASCKVSSWTGGYRPRPLTTVVASRRSVIVLFRWRARGGRPRPARSSLVPPRPRLRRESARPQTDVRAG